MRAKIKIIFTIIITSALTQVTIAQNLTFAVIGDFGMSNQAESDVADLLKSWNPDFIITISMEKHQR